MRLTVLLLVAAASLSAEERVYPLANALTPEAGQEVATILRTVLSLREVKQEDGPQFRIGGPGADFGASEWLLHRLDRPVGWRPSEQEMKNPATRDYQSAVRVYYLPTETSVRSIQETLTILRTVLDVQKVFNYSQQKALIVGDTKAQLEAIEWLLGAMTGTVPSAPYKLEGKSDDMLRVFALPHGGATEVQNLIKDLRGKLRIQKVFNRTNPALVVVRGKATDLDAADKLIGSLK